MPRPRRQRRPDNDDRARLGDVRRVESGQVLIGDDEDVYIHGRNVILVSKAAVYLSREEIPSLLLGTLAGNPFPDATPQFFDVMARALALGLGAPISIEAPFAEMKKADVIRLGRSLGVPFELTLSCMQPKNGRHCGRCSKCRERIEAFREAGENDAADYVTR